MSPGRDGSGDECLLVGGGRGGFGFGVADDQGGQQGGSQDGDRADGKGGGHRGGIGLAGDVDQAGLPVRGGQGASDRLPGLPGRACRHVAGGGGGGRAAEGG